MEIHELKQIRTRIDQLSARHEQMLEGFWVKDRSTFAQYPGDTGNHVTTACTCVLSFLDAPGGKLPGFLEEKRSDFLNWLLSVKWDSEGLGENNPYTAPLALTALLKLADRRVLDEARPRGAVQALLTKLQGSESGGISMPKYPPNGFLTYWTIRALGDALVHYQKGWWSNALDQVTATRKGIEAATRWAEEETYRHVAYYHANDLDRYDAFQLAYGLAIVDHTRAASGVAPDRVLITKGLEVLFASQLGNGLWPKGVPLFHYADAGSVYPFAFETLTAVMRLGSREGIEHSTFSVEFFEPHIGSLLRTLRWAETHEIASEGLQGWRSNNVLPGRRPQPWATAMVLSFVRGLDVLFQGIVQERLLDEFGALRFPASRTTATFTSDSWTKLDDAQTPLAPSGSTTIKKLLFDYLLSPHLPEKDGQQPQKKKLWSAVLFGPPGTAKTTLAEDIARTLGWPLITIETSDFLAQGVDKMAHQARLLFRKLEHLREVVVFVDEVEEFVRKRNDADRQSRLTTTAMLTLLQRFRRKRRCILILATNHPEVFDPAITRPGRFDLMVLVKPPGLDSKIALWRKKREQHLAGDKLDKEVEILSANRDLVERFTFDEWGAFVDRFGADAEDRTGSLACILRDIEDSLTIDGEQWGKHWATLKSVIH